jgi:hypothetical protein
LFKIVSHFYLIYLQRLGNDKRVIGITVDMGVYDYNWSQTRNINEIKIVKYPCIFCPLCFYSFTAFVCTLKNSNIVNIVTNIRARKETWLKS